VKWDRQTLEGFDVVIIATNHQVVSYQELADWSPCIVDTRNAMGGGKNQTGTGLEGLKMRHAKHGRQLPTVLSNNRLISVYFPGIPLFS